MWRGRPPQAARRLARLVLASLAATVLLAASCGAQGHCPTDPTICKMTQASDGATCKDKLTGACWCSRMAYILATYEPAPTQGLHALDTVCNWWSMKMLIGKTGSPPATPVECMNKCVMMAKMMQTSSSGPWSAWMGPAHSCCSFFAPGVPSFLELDSSSSLLASAARDRTSSSFLRSMHGSRAKQQQQQLTPLGGWDEGAVRDLVEAEVGAAPGGRPDWVPADWVLREEAKASP